MSVNSQSVRTRRNLWVFLSASIVVLIVIGVGTVFVARTLAQAETLRAAEDNSDRMARLVVAPLLADALAGNPQRRDELDRAIRLRLADGNISEIVVWRPDGLVVFADNPAVVGRTFPVPEQVEPAISQGVVSSNVDIGDDTHSLPPDTRLVEVYVPLDAPGLPRLAFEVYYSATQLDARAATLSVELLLLGVIPLVVLQLIQIPIATRLSRRVSRQEAERVTLLARTLSASERERQRIASDLHDGVVQDLAGVGYAISALAGGRSESERAMAERCATTVQDAVAGLRQLMVDIYPPELTGPGLLAEIEQLARPLRAQGIGVEIEIGSLPDLEAEVVATVYRVVRETLLNVAKHAHAGHVGIRLVPAGRGVRLRITDDGVGVGVGVLDRRSDGHFGLTLLADRVSDLGGTFTVQPGARGGTVTETVLPRA